MDQVFKWILSVAILGVCFLILKYLKAKQIQQENKITEAYMHSLEIFCGEIQKRIEYTRRFRHDLKGYIQTLEALLRTEEDNEIIRQYVKEQKKRHSELGSPKFCSDEFVNTILHMKQKECEQKGLPCRFEIADDDYSGMKEMDKVCLLINLLDNVIEATERLQQKDVREIRMQMCVDNNEMKIYLENALAKEEMFSFHTKKADRKNHGFGTSIIQQVLDKYEGKRITKVDEEHHLLKDEICLTLKREETAVCGN